MLTADNSRQMLKLDEIERLKQRIFRLSEEIVETRRTRGGDAALALLERDRAAESCTARIYQALRRHFQSLEREGETWRLEPGQIVESLREADERRREADAEQRQIQPRRGY